jgi:hypothetical protein
VPTFFFDIDKMRNLTLILKIRKGISPPSILILVSLVCTGCMVTNRFTPPKNLPQVESKKRLILFRVSVVDIEDRIKQTKLRSPDYPLIGIPNGNKRIINFTQPLSGNCTYVLDISAADTGSITLLMGAERLLFGKKIYTDTTIHFKDLTMGNNYWHLNYFLEGFSKIGWAPVLKLREIDLSKDDFQSYFRLGFRYALWYDLSADSIIYEKKKAIVSNQKGINNIYKNIKKSSTSVDSLLAARQK